MKISKNDLIIMLKDKVYMIKPLPASVNTIQNNPDEYIGSAFISDGGKVYPYIKYTESVKDGVYGWYIADNKLMLKEPRKESNREMYHIRHAIDTDTEKMIAMANKLAEENPKKMEIPGDPSDTPEIKDTDDFLTKTVKQIILSKNINIKNQIKRSNINKNDASNMISGLKSDRDMSLLYFFRWVEVLGFDFKLIATDNGDDPDAPLKEVVIVDNKGLVGDN